MCVGGGGVGECLQVCGWGGGREETRQPASGTSAPPRPSPSSPVLLGLFVCTLIWYLGVVGIFSCCFFLLLSWVFEQDFWDTCCFGCHLCFVFLYLHLFSAVEHVSHGEAL